MRMKIIVLLLNCRFDVYLKYFLISVEWGLENEQRIH